MYSASFFFNLETDEEAKVIEGSLKPEIQHKIPKTDVKLSVIKNSISLKIQANDLSSLRAACNSYLRWINTALMVKKTI